MADQTVPPPRELDGAVHLWHGSLSDERWTAHNTLHWLDSGEESRAERIRDPLKRARFVSAHLFLRSLLGAYTGLSPDALQFDRAAGGKPSISVPVGADRPHTSLAFNMSHSHDRIAVAIAHNRLVGVDLELIEDFPELDTIATEHFADSELALLRQAQTQGDRIARFHAIWTRKEACLKAVGAGLTTPLSSFSSLEGPASQAPWTRVELFVSPPQIVFVRECRVGDKYACSIALSSEADPVRIFDADVTPFGGIGLED